MKKIFTAVIALLAALGLVGGSRETVNPGQEELAPNDWAVLLAQQRQSDPYLPHSEQGGGYVNTFQSNFPVASASVSSLPGDGFEDGGGVVIAMTPEGPKQG